MFPPLDFDLADTGRIPGRCEGQDRHFGCRPLLWFVFLESLTEGRSQTALVDRRLYRKAPLFDRFVKFDVQVERPDIHH